MEMRGMNSRGPPWIVPTGGRRWNDCEYYFDGGEVAPFLHRSSSCGDGIGASVGELVPKLPFGAGPDVHAHVPRTMINWWGLLLPPLLTMTTNAGRWRAHCSMSMLIPIPMPYFPNSETNESVVGAVPD